MFSDKWHHAFLISYSKAEYFSTSTSMYINRIFADEQFESILNVDKQSGVVRSRYHEQDDPLLRPSTLLIIINYLPGI